MGRYKSRRFLLLCLRVKWIRLEFVHDSFSKKPEVKGWDYDFMNRQPLQLQSHLHECPAHGPHP